MAVRKGTQLLQPMTTASSNEMEAIHVVILAGGLGTRLAEETNVRPKPMVEVGDRPLLLHIMDIYAGYGSKKFLIALGYKGEVIKNYFLDLHITQGDITINLATGKVAARGARPRDWTIQLVDTGINSMTGGRLHRLAPQLKERGTFMLTYGDGVSDVDLTQLLAFHRKHGKLMTVTAVRPPARFGSMSFDGDRITEFKEKPQASEGWINGGFFVCEPGVFEYLHGDETVLEGDPLERLAADGQLMAFRHTGFWKCMDTQRDKTQLNELWRSGKAPWQKVEK